MTSITVLGRYMCGEELLSKYGLTTPREYELIPMNSEKIMPFTEKTKRYYDISAWYDDAVPPCRCSYKHYIRDVMRILQRDKIYFGPGALYDVFDIQSNVIMKRELISAGLEKDEPGIRSAPFGVIYGVVVKNFTSAAELVKLIGKLPSDFQFFNIIQKY